MNIIFIIIVIIIVIAIVIRLRRRVFTRSFLQGKAKNFLERAISPRGDTIQPRHSHRREPTSTATASEWRGRTWKRKGLGGGLRKGASDDARESDAEGDQDGT